MAEKKSGAKGRKIGRNKIKCASYRGQGRLTRNKQRAEESRQLRFATAEDRRSKKTWTDPTTGRTYKAASRVQKFVEARQRRQEAVDKKRASRARVSLAKASSKKSVRVK